MYLSFSRRRLGGGGCQVTGEGDRRGQGRGGRRKNIMK